MVHTAQVTIGRAHRPQVALTRAQWHRTLEAVSTATPHELFILTVDETQSILWDVREDSPLFDTVRSTPAHVLAALHHTGHDLWMLSDTITVLPGAAHPMQPIGDETHAFWRAARVLDAPSWRHLGRITWPLEL